MPIYGQRDQYGRLINPKLRNLDISTAPSGALESLPRFQEVIEAGVGEIGHSVFMRGWNAKKASNAAVGAQYQAASVLSTVGAPLGSAAYRGLIDLVSFDDPGGAIRSIVSSYAGQIAGSVLDKIVDELMEIVEEALEDVMGSVFEAIGSIPIVGWILDAAMEIATLIINIIELVQIKKSAGPIEQEFSPASFQPDLDRDLARTRIIEVMKNSVDWTNIFMPPNLYDDAPQTWKSLKLDRDQGRRLFAEGDHGEEWLGVIPGTSVVDRGFEVNPKASQSMPFLRNIGTLLPSTRDMGSICWGQIVGSDGWKRTSPALFAIDADRAIRAWQEYLFYFRIRLREGTGLSLNESTRKNIVNKLAGENGIYGWKKWGASYDEKKGFDNFGINQSAPIVALKALKRRQYETLNRVDVAYVASHYGALQSKSSSMYARWKKNRELLLNHHARCLVDVANIPDVSYRLAMESATENCIPAHLGTLTAVPVSPKLPGAGSLPPASPPRYQANTTKVRLLIGQEVKKRRRTKGKGGNLMLIGLGVAFLAIASKRK